MKKYLITGLLVWIPLAITLWVLHLIVTTMDNFLRPMLIKRGADLPLEIHQLF